MGLNYSGCKILLVKYFMSHKSAVCQDVMLAIKENGLSIDPDLGTILKFTKGGWKEANFEIRSDGYSRFYFKCSTGNYSCMAHKAIWMFVNGDIAPGYRIKFISGPSLNISNLKLVDMKELAQNGIKAAKIANSKQHLPPNCKIHGMNPPDGWLILLKRKTCKSCEIPRKAKYYLEKGHIQRNREHLARVKLKFEVLSKYCGGTPECQLCHQMDVDCLCLDHFNNDGKEHRKQVRTSYIYRWAKANNYPQIFRVLCHNCNMLEARKFKPLSDSYNSKKKQRLKRAIFSKYSTDNKCQICKESNLDLLTIDHMDGGGTKHRKEIGHHIYDWLRKHKYPAGFQVLCFNCNIKKSLIQLRSKFTDV